MVKLDILHVKTSHGFVEESDVNIIILLNFLPVTGSKIKIDECTLLGSFTYARRRTTNLSKTLYNVHCTLINKPL